MDLDSKFIAAERRLSQEGKSFGEVLEQIRYKISPALIGDHGWEKVLARAKKIPASVAAFPFGFELPLHEHDAQADFGISLIGGTESVEFFEQRGSFHFATPQEAGLSWLLQNTKLEDSAVRKIVGRKLMLEYDVASVSSDAHPAPGIFLRPSEQPILGGNQQSQACSIVLDAIVTAVGWESCSQEHRHVKRVYQAQENGTRIDSFGAFPSRKRCIRIAITGFRNVHDVVKFLQSVDWSGCRHPMVASTIRHFEESNAFVEMGVHLDLNSNGLGSTLGLSFLPKERVVNDPRYWLDHPAMWDTFIDGLREGDLGKSDKLSALADWQSAPEMLISQSGTLVFIRGIHHIKIVIREDQVIQVKAYIYCLICPWQDGNAVD